MPTANHVLLQRITLTDSATTAVILNSIPQTGYTDLKLVFSGRFSSGSGFNLINFNGLSTANFSNKILEGSGSAASSFASGSTNYAGPLNGSGDTANTFSNQEIYIPNYTSSNFKSITFDGVMENNGTTAYMDMGAILWSNTAAITSIRLQTHTGAAYAAGSSFSLYGIANATAIPAAAPKADGGDIIKTDGTYWYHAFTSTGSFKPQLNLTADVLVVAGGGGGGSAGGAGYNGGAGGGAGGLRLLASQALSNAVPYTCTIGAGGTTASSAVSTAGSNSSFTGSGFSTINVTGGGFGGRNGAADKNGGNGGSGGGAGATSAIVGTAGTGNAGSYSPVEGYSGGAGSSNGTTYDAAGGGGGAGGVGGAASSGACGAGGTGANAYNGTTFTSWLTATSTGSSGYLAGGGGGGGVGSPTSGTAGTGGGGSGTNGGTPGNGVANTGSGGGGAGAGAVGGTGGSGIIIIRYPV